MSQIPHNNSNPLPAFAYNSYMFTSVKYIDMHCHLGFSPDALSLAAEGKNQGLAFLNMTVDPRDFPEQTAIFRDEKNVRTGAGLHPRWLADETCGAKEVDTLCSLIGDIPLVGEIGLDFSKPYVHAKEAQLRAFEQICKTCASSGGKLLSIHALRCATYVLDILESCEAYKNCACIMHWFSGSNEELWRAIDLGCWFSINERMLATKQGAEYAKLIPEQRLLLETDLPSQPEEEANAKQLLASLEATTEQLARIRKISDPNALRERILANSLTLLP